tara:strand:- start:376 stop:723 length:348 start_codon:yes stop_codon:yes gene_type:complete
MVSEMSLYSMQEDNYLDEDMDGVEKLSCGCYEEMCECPQCEICGEIISPDLEECENVGEDWHNPEDWDSETFEAEGKKRSGILSEPFEDLQGKSVVFGIIIGIVALLGFGTAFRR